MAWSAVGSGACASEMSREERSRLTADWFDEARGCAGAAARLEVEQRIVVLNLQVALNLARRYRDRGLALDDLEQTASMALVRVVAKFDPSRGFDFMSYAVPTIDGELKRLFRDRGWTIKVPRRIREVQTLIAREQRTSSAPADPDLLAARLGLPRSAVLEALQAQGCFAPTSLDLPVGAEGNATLGGILPVRDTGLAAAEARAMVVPILRSLSDRDRDRDRRILTLRYYQDLNQGEIGREVGLSQMQVSRILTRLHEHVREALDGPPAARTRRSVSGARQ